MNVKIEQIIKTPLELVKEIGLLDNITKTSKLSDLNLKNYETREKSFDWIHLGSTNLKIGNLLSSIKNTKYLLPPRTGHIGNWNDIALGRSGMIDYNKTICAEQNVGYPLVYAFNQTEDDNLSSGDWIYMPGSLIEDGTRVPLSLYTWNGIRFAKRTREQSYFTPFVQTEILGDLIPLVKLHWDRMNQYEGFNFKLEASIIWEKKELFRDILYVLLESATSESNQQRALLDILSHMVSTDGVISRSNLTFDGSGYLIGDTYYKNSGALVEAALIPFMAACEPNVFFSNISEFPKDIPVASNNVVAIISAMFNTHYPGCDVNRKLMTTPFNPHLHWGAIGMAGYPPIKKGYFAEKSSIKTSTNISQTIVNSFNEIDPIFFILIPASAFTICPTSHHHNDLELINELINNILNQTNTNSETDILLREVYQIVDSWLNINKNKLSLYFINRFASRRSVLNQIELPNYSDTIVPEKFEELTFRQSSMIVGVLIELLNDKYKEINNVKIR